MLRLLTSYDAPQLQDSFLRFLQLIFQECYFFCHVCEFHPHWPKVLKQADRATAAEHVWAQMALSVIFSNLCFTKTPAERHKEDHNLLHCFQNISFTLAFSFYTPNTSLSGVVQDRKNQDTPHFTFHFQWNLPAVGPWPIWLNSRTLADHCLGYKLGFYFLNHADTKMLLTLI